MEIKKFLMSRTMFCEKCFTGGHPRAGDTFIVYGGSGQELYMRKVEEAVNSEYIGFTPHIILYTEPLTMEDKKVKVLCSCGICEVTYKYVKASLKFTFEERKIVLLDERDFAALLLNRIDTDCYKIH